MDLARARRSPRRRAARRRHCAAGPQARTTTPPLPGARRAPRAGSWCSRSHRARRAPRVVDCFTRSPAGALIPATGIADPVGPVVELVAQLVDGLLELEDRQQLVDRRLARRAAGRVDGVEVAVEEAPRARAASQSSGASAAARTISARRAARRRTSAASPRRRAAASASARRSGSDRAGSPSKSRIDPVARRCAGTWPRW